MKKLVENRNYANFTENWYKLSTKERKTVKVKGKVCKMLVRLAMTYGLETVELTKRLEAVQEVAKLDVKIFVLSDQEGQN